MSAILCEFNTVNGDDTNLILRKGPANCCEAVDALYRTDCDNGQFYIESSDGGTNDYYRLLNPEKYGINAGVPVYINISSTHLLYPKASEISTLAAEVEAAQVANTTTPSGSSTTDTDTVNATEASTFQYSQGLDDTITSMIKSISDTQQLSVNTRVFGTPFQFIDTADNRPYDNINYGRKYLENIVAEAPIVYLTPGLPNYMPDADRATRDSMDAYIAARSSNQNIGAEAMSSILNTELRYYGFIPAYSEYMRYVNLLCRVCAMYMNIGDRTVPGTSGEKYKTYDWGKWTNMNYTSTDESDGNSLFTKIAAGVGGIVGGGIAEAATAVKDKVTDELFGQYMHVKCYVDPNISFNESASNTTQQSMVTGLFDSLESIVKEIGFFSNGGGISSALPEFISNIGSGVGSGATNLLDPDLTAGLSKIVGNATHVISGSNAIFPELWGDSAYNKSYNITVNLVSPYGDVESEFLHIIVPMMHLLALSMPRQTSANSFGSPFLVKAFAKGWFSCDLGIVDSISIEKDPTTWNIYGFPNEVKVSLSIKDLYSNLMISKTTEPGLFFANQGLIEFLAVTCSIDITVADIGLKIVTILSTYAQTLFDIPSNLYDNFIQAARNAIEPWFKITR